MKTQLSSVCRRLRATVLLLAACVGTSLSMAAVTLANAHADLAAGNFAALKTDTETLIAGAAENRGEAHVLHAIALLGLAAKNDVPSFLVSLGANAGATIDPLGGGTSVDFPTVFVYDSGASWTQSGATYTLTKAFNYGDENKPLICFENRGKENYTLALQLGTSVGSFFDFMGSIILNGSDWGFIDAYSVNGQQYLWGQWPGSLEGSVDMQTSTVTFTLRPGDNLTVEDGVNSAGVRFTILGSRPSTLVVLNGKGVYDSHPKFAAKANLTGFFTFAAKEDPAVIAPIVDDLAAVTATNFQMTLPANETGHPVDIVIQYPDVQLLIGFFKFNQGMFLLSKSYNWSFDLSGGTFLEATDPLAVFKKNAALLSAATGSKAADRTAARQLLDAAGQCYVNADTAGLWTRTPLMGASYLFGVDTEAVNAADQRAQMLQDVATFRTLLTDRIPVGDVFPSFASAEHLSDTSTFSLAPFFAATPLNIRGILPTFTNNGIQAGTSVKLLTSGLLNGVGSGPWEDYLWIEGVTDETVEAAKVAPVIFVQPQGAAVVAGDSVTFSVQADAYPVPTYQWKKNGAVIPDATGTSYTIDPVAGTDDASYTVSVTNSVKSVTSAAAKLVVGFAPVISTQPASQSVKAGTTVKFTVVASGNPAPKYQWRLNGAPIPKATGAAYSVKASALTAGDYDVVVSNSLGDVPSSVATLDAVIPPSITVQPVSQNVTAGDTVTLSVTAAGSDPKTYQWMNGKTVVPGATSSSYVIDPVAGTDAGTYTVVVTNGAGKATSKPAKLAVTYAPVISTQPVSQSVKAGTTVKFTVVASGNPAPKYQWRFNGTPIPKATGAAYTVKASEAKAGSYDVVVTNSVDSVTSSPAVLSLQSMVIGVMKEQ